MSRSAGAGLLLAAGALLAVTVDVRAGERSVVCGSAWDVVSGRSGWQQWFAQDLADPLARASLPRTDSCVGAVNSHILGATGLAVVGLFALGVAPVIGRGRRPLDSNGRAADRLRRIGRLMKLIGSLLTVTTLVGIALLTADPHAPLFLYVSRPVVVLLGLLLVLPAALIVVLGHGACVVADQLNEKGSAREST